MKRLSIRARLTLWYTGILAATLILLGGASYGLLMRGLWQDADATLEGVAKTVAQAASGPRAGLIPPGMDEVLRRFFGPSFADRFYQFLDPRGQLDPRLPRFGEEPLHISPNALKNAAEGYATFETVTSGGRFPVRVLTFPVMQDGQIVNVLQVGMSLEGLYMARQHFLWTLAALVPLAVVLAGGGLGSLAGVSARAWFYLGVSVLTAFAVGDTAFFESTKTIGLARAMTVSMVYPLIASGLGVWLLGERITAQVAAGAVVTLAGLALIVSERAPATALQGRGHQGRGLGLALLAAMAWGVSPVLMKPAIVDVDPVSVQAVRLPARSPNLNAWIERFVRSIKEECLDRMIFFGESSLRRAVPEFIAHYVAERNHQGLGNRIIQPDGRAAKASGPVRSSERLGGMLRYYYRDAA